MKRYVLFCSQQELTEGGWEDMHGDYDTIEEAQQFFRQATS